jgi:two-component system nitrogen regulation response regulator GlnG
MSQLLVIDDDPLVLESVRAAFATTGIDLDTAENATEGLAKCQRLRPDVIVVDWHLPDLSGLEVFDRLRQMGFTLPVILMTGHGSATTAIEAMRRGAFDYLLKPIDPTQLIGLVQRALEMSRLMCVPTPPASANCKDDEEADLLIGACPAMQEVFKAIGRVAPRDVTVLIRGESGTGKELVARAIHQHSNRANGRFLALNCAAIPETLLESELFGHERGAFTGADRKRIGKFEQCNGGTLFLDEIGDMTPLTQTKVLRVLQDQQFQRVGGELLIHTDVRLIAATNRNLEAMLSDGRFRSDLYYRLNVFTIWLPPLRERPGDVPLLVEHFLKRASLELDKQVTYATPETLALLERYSWPGNVRELQSVLKQAILRAPGTVLLPEFLPAAIRGETESLCPHTAPRRLFGDCLHEFIAERMQAGSSQLHAEVFQRVELQLLLEVMQRTNNNLSEAARILGITRKTLRTRLLGLGIGIDHNSSVSN